MAIESTMLLIQFNNIELESECSNFEDIMLTDGFQSTLEHTTHTSVFRFEERDKDLIQIRSSFSLQENDTTYHYSES